MTADQITYAKACELAWLDGHQDGINGMNAVLYVLRNRRDQGWNGGDLCRVVHEAMCFSESRYESTTVGYPDPREPNYQAVIQGIESIFENNSLDKLTGGGVYYSRYNSSDRVFAPNQNKPLKQCAVVGQLKIYREAE